MYSLFALASPESFYGELLGGLMTHTHPSTKPLPLTLPLTLPLLSTHPPTHPGVDWSLDSSVIFIKSEERNEVYVHDACVHMLTPRVSMDGYTCHLTHMHATLWV